MNTASLSFKLISLTVGTILVVILMFSGLVYVNFRDIFKKQLVDKGVQLADFLNKHSSISYGIMAEEKFLLSEAINLFMRDEDVIFASAINRKGEILAFKTKDQKIAEDISWFISGIVSENGVSDRRIIERKTATGEEIIMFLYPVKSEKEGFGIGVGEQTIKGYTALVLTLQNFYRDFFRRISLIGLTIGVATIFVAILMAYLIRSNIKPLVHLKDRTEKISKEGELREKVEVETGDEIQEIAESFSRMIEILKNEIHNIKIVSKKLSDMSQDIYKTMEKINLNTAEQNSKILEIEALVDGIHNREFNTVMNIDSIVETMESIFQKISEIDNSISYVRDTIQYLPQKSDEVISDILDIKRGTEELGHIDILVSQIDEFSKSIETLKRIISETLENSREIYALLDVLGEGVYQIVSESDNISSCIINIRKIKNDLSDLLSSAQKEIEEIMGVVFELLDFTDDTNMLAINASIIASHEKGQRGKEFGVVAEEIKKLSQDTENKIKKIKDKLKNINQKISSAVRISETNIEENITDVSNTKENISSGINKSKNIVEEVRTKFSSSIASLEKSVQNLAGIDTKIFGIQDLSQRVIRVFDLAKRNSDHADPILREMNNVLVRISEELNITSDKINKTGPTVAKLTSELVRIKDESRSQFSEIEDIKNKTRDLGNIIYEINKIVTFSLSKVKLVSELGTRLERITKHYKT
ncbi:MAG: methyl-accepting chemotaxis protein [Candidatus Calescibacterium sp.]|nr:methyl-accepting chemotaxis protein [Candidatus Calescibacterium sp.]MDW8087167.1 methyl-accepting chemotaxis protein [Candidatus Calescibacterium sp.]